MNRIACLGSSHTEGGWLGEHKEFENSWPGQLYQRLNNTDVLNTGEASFSIEFWPTKIYNIINYYNPTHIIVEINMHGKLDVEITRDLTDDSPQNAKNYHPLLTRQNVSSPQGRTNNKYWPNRTSVSTGEAIDYYTLFNKLNQQDLEEYYDGNVPLAISEMYNDLQTKIITDVEKVWVKDKLSDMVASMGDREKDLDLLLNYLYFKAVYETGSDQYMARYFQNIDHMRLICKQNDIKFHCFTVQEKDWLDNQIYLDNYQELWKDMWLFDDINFALKSWVRRKYKEKYPETLGDSIHYYPWVFGEWCDEMLVPWLKEKYGSDF